MWELDCSFKLTKAIEFLEIDCAGMLALQVEFLHKWRRHVCRDCTGHLALGRIELLARLREPRKETHKPKTQHKQQNKTRPPFLHGWRRYVCREAKVTLLNKMGRELRCMAEHQCADPVRRPWRRTPGGPDAPTFDCTNPRVDGACVHGLAPLDGRKSQDDLVFSPERDVNCR